MKRAEAKTKERRVLTGKAEAILEGAMHEFLAHGYAATSMDRVAATANVSKATVYSYFRDKENLFNALVERLAGERFRSVFSLLGDEHLKENPGVVLRSLAVSGLDIAAKDEYVVPFMRLIVGESGRFPELARAYVNHIAKPILENLSHYFAAHPELEITDPQATARVFIGALVYFIIVQEVLHGKKILPMKRERFIDGLLSLTLGAGAQTG